MEQQINKEVFDKFFEESYCVVEYENVKEEFEEVASAGNDIFTGSYEARNLNRDNFILYLTSESYCDFEAIVQEAMDDLNPEILDAVMDVTEAQPDGDEDARDDQHAVPGQLTDDVAAVRDGRKHKATSLECWFHYRYFHPDCQGCAKRDCAGGKSGV